MDHPLHQLTPIPSDAAHRVLVRAAELDASLSGAFTVQQLRDIATESGIDQVAFEAALRELGPELSRLGEPAPPRAPWWVRLCMTGVPDRVAATRYYWLLVTMMLASPAIVWASPSPGGVIGAGALMAFSFFSIWSTSQSIRWLDKHSWEAER